MANKFPHISDTNFPNVEQVDVYNLRNTYDYSKFDRTQMKITICSVPWDVGLIHVGNAQIGGLGNVVYFENEEARDNYLNSIENKFTWETKYRDYHDGGFIEVPLPYEQCVLYNYCYCEYETLPVQYGASGKKKFFFFIRSCEFLSVNTTKIEILRDTWQTYIYDVDITHMMLERGHAPMSLTNADRYLSNPIANTQYLLADDVSYSDTMISKYASSIVLNHENMLAVIVMTGNPRATWGSKAANTWQVPSTQTYEDGVPNYYAIATEAARLSTLLINMNIDRPQAIQTIQGVFFVSADLVTITNTFELLGVECYLLNQATRTLNLATLTKQAFGYGTKYENLAKLYTYPYAYLEITDESGNVRQVRIEETSGNLSLIVTTSLAYPWLTLDGRISGIGSGAGNITFANVNQHTFSFDGDWYDYLYKWNIPTFAVTQNAADVYNYSTHFVREQKTQENLIAKTNAYDNALTAKTNADASATTTHANAIRSATAAKTNADATDNIVKTNADASANTAQTNAYASALNAKTNAYANAATTRAASKASATATETNAKNTANAAETNAKNTARLDKGNNDRMAKVQYDNTNDLADAAKENADRNALTAYTNATRDNAANKTKFDNERLIANGRVEYETTFDYGLSLLDRSFGNLGANAELQATKMSDDWDTDFTLQMLDTNSENYYTVAASVLNGFSGAISSIAGGAVAGAVGGPGGMGIGAVSGAVGSGVSLATTAASIPIVVGKTTELRQLGINAGNQKTRHAIDYAYNSAAQAKAHLTNINNLEGTYLTTNAVLAKTTADTDALDLQTAANRNATKNQTTDKANNQRTYDKVLLNNADSKTTADTNAENTRTAAYTNAENTRTIAHTNADNAETNAQNVADNDKTLAEGNADRTNATALQNNARTNTTALDNNTRTFNAAKDNADATKATALENNLRTYNNAIAIADRNKATADQAILNNLKQAALDAPSIFGNMADGETATTRPQGIFCNIVTQPQDAIEQAGDYFLRFGYAVNRSWDFTTFNLMPKFTYWKASDMWISGNNVPDKYLDEIRFYLLGGVCVWRDPEDIGNISIYENN